DNLLVDDNGRLAVIDFQITGTGAASYDLGYFLSQSLEPEVRRPINDALIDRYFEALGQTGVQFDREFLTRVFRLSTAWCLIYPVSTFAGWEELPEQTRDMARVMLRRAVSSIHDQGALALLPPA
ncbi:MAG: phosphotransferase, partial [Actinomycetota bacterium]